MDGLTLNPQTLTLGSFSLLSKPPVSGNAQVGQICDQCQICDHDGDCWDFKGDDGKG